MYSSMTLTWCLIGRSPQGSREYMGVAGWIAAALRAGNGRTPLSTCERTALLVRSGSEALSRENPMELPPFRRGGKMPAPKGMPTRQRCQVTNRPRKILLLKGSQCSPLLACNSQARTALAMASGDQLEIDQIAGVAFSTFLFRSPGPPRGTPRSSPLIDRPADSEDFSAGSPPPDQS